MIIKINGLKTNFEVYGNGAPLVILHGWGDNIKNWRTVANILSSDLKVYLVDLPGFGYSEMPHSVWGAKEYADFVSDFIKDLEIKNPVIFGHSMGGKIASFYSAYQRSGSKNVSKLILSSSSGLEKRSILTLFKILLFKLVKLILFPLGKNRRRVLKVLVKAIGSADYKNAGRLRKSLVKLVNRKLSNILPKIKIPTLIIWGEKDKVLPLTLAKEFKRLIPNSQMRVLWGVGHFPHIEEPKELSKLIKEFAL